MRTVAIIPAAGQGRRLALKKKKPFVLLKGKPLVYYALKALNESCAIDGIIIASERSCIRHFKNLIKKFGFKKVKAVVVGGKERVDSVRNCLRVVDRSFDMVLVHDAARPFLEEGLIWESLRLAKRYGGCIVAVPESDTVKLADRDMFIKDTLKRDSIFRAQTPQVFRRDLIEKAYRRAKVAGVTDDAALAEAIGVKIKILEGSYRNIKITTKEDLKLAEVLLCGSA